MGIMKNDDLAQEIQAGSLIVFQEGAYSDCVSLEPMRVLKTFVKKDAVAAFDKWWRRQRTQPFDSWLDELGDPRPSDFIAWMTSNGFVEDLPVDSVHTWHVGSYGDFSP